MDAKGRMAVPARYRDALQSLCDGSLVATIDMEDKCLLIYPLPEWEKIEAKIASLPTFDAGSRRLQRLLIGHSRELDLDGNGRILIPPELRAHALLQKKVVLVGQSHRFELWDQQQWNEKRAEWLDEADGSEVPVTMQSLSL